MKKKNFKNLYDIQFSPSNSFNKIQRINPLDFQKKYKIKLKRKLKKDSDIEKLNRRYFARRHG